jgi:hypothetical protein
LAPGAAAAGAPTLLLYSSCRDFVLAIASGGPAPGGSEIRRRFVRGLLTERLRTGWIAPRWRQANFAHLTDLQLAALIWHIQMAEFRAIVAAPAPGVRSLDCEAFLTDPARALAALDALFGLNLGAARVEAIVHGPALQRYAKGPSASYSALQRRATLSAAEAALGDELDALVAWSYEICPETPRGDPVGAPLLPVQG